MGRLGHRSWPAVVLCGLATALVGGCGFGPMALERSHGRYNEAVRLVEEEQFLRNIVHLRYNELPLELNISSIAAQYELSATSEARPFFEVPNPTGQGVFQTFTRILPDVLVEGANRPTITLDPANDSAAVRRFLTPIPADTLLLLGQTSWPVSTILRLWVERLNGVPNAVTASGPARGLVPDFVRFERVAELVQRAQDGDLMALHPEERVTKVGGPLPAQAVTAAALVDAAKNGLEYQQSEDNKTYDLVRRERRLVLQVHPSAAGSPELAELTDLLHLVPGLPRYDLITTTGAADPLDNPRPPSASIAIEPRSTIQVLFYLANGVEVPAEHVRRGLVRSAIDAEGRVSDMRAVTRGLFEVHVCACHRRPANAFVAVKYRGYWYYVDDRDQDSKTTLALVLQLSRLEFGRQRTGAGPQLTLPVGR
jgi:hypothetical protein